VSLDDPFHNWTFAGEADQTIAIYMGTTDGNLDSYLTVLGPDGSFIAEDDNSGGGLDSLIFVTLPDSGQYLIEARAWDPETSEGSYLLEITEGVGNFIEGDMLGELTPDVPVSSFRAVGVTDQWTFAGEAGDVISIAMVADESDLDGYLVLLGPNGAIVTQPATTFTEPSSSSTQLDAAQVDDIMTVNGRSANNSWLQVTFEDGDGNLIDGYVSANRVNYAGSITTLPIIEASDNSSSPGSTTPITGTTPLTPTVESGDGANTPPVSDIYQSFIGYDSTNTSSLGQNKRHIWEFDGSAGDMVDISMASSDGSLDSYLWLYAPDGSYLADDDDSYGGSDAFISFQLPDTGSYTIIATGFEETTFGPYELYLSLFTP